MTVVRSALIASTLAFMLVPAPRALAQMVHNDVQVNPDSLTVQWWFELNLRWYPWEKLGVFVYDRKLGPVMEESLDSLKRYVENSR